MQLGTILLYIEPLCNRSSRERVPQPFSHKRLKHSHSMISRLQSPMWRSLPRSPRYMLGKSFPLFFIFESCENRFVTWRCHWRSRRMTKPLCVSRRLRPEEAENQNPRHRPKRRHPRRASTQKQNQNRHHRNRRREQREKIRKGRNVKVTRS